MVRTFQHAEDLENAHIEVWGGTEEGSEEKGKFKGLGSQ